MDKFQRRKKRSRFFFVSALALWEDGELKTENGWGRIVKREPFGYAYRDHAVRERERDPRKHKVERQPYDGPVIEV